VIGVSLSVAGAVLVRRLIPQEKLIENNDYAGFTYGILGLIYGIYLAFTVVVVWQQYEDAEEQVMQEVVVLNALWRNVAVFDTPIRAKLHGDLITYARFVVKEEWPLMAPGLYSTPSPAYDQIWTDFYSVMPNADDPREAAFYAEAIGRLNELAMARRLRLLSSTAGLPRSMWVLLIIGAAGTIMFTWVYGTRYLSLQIAITMFLSVVILYSVLLVSMLEHPFGGTVAVSPVPFQDLIRTFEERQASYSAHKN
jgi:Protein of unknown function (DUF4239)